MRRLLTTVAAVLALPSATLAAQEIGTVDVGLAGRVSIIDSDVSDDIGLSLAGRFGVFMFRNIALELEHAAGGTNGDPSVRLSPFYMRLAYHRQLNENWSAIAGAGWVRDRFKAPGMTERFVDDGYTFNVGAMRKLKWERTALRFDIIADHMGEPVPGVTLTNFHVQAGINWRWGGSPSGSDADGDGVADAMDRCPNTLAGSYVNYYGCQPEGDADNDGVLDSADRCPNTPAGVAVTSDGCPVDTDRDGVPDHLDRCPNTPAGVPVTAEGCPRDSDGDGVTDDKDRCPNTPAGTRVNAEGCPLDSDGDGVPDNIDACPNTPPGTPVDARGCRRIFEEGKANVVLEGVTFATGSSRLTPESNEILDRVAQALIENPEINVEVQGHTDNTGSVAANTRISQARAAAVRQYLISKGVAANRLTARGYGPSEPTASNDTPEGRQQNRRVELKRTN